MDNYNLDGFGNFLPRLSVTSLNDDDENNSAVEVDHVDEIGHGQFHGHNYYRHNPDLDAEDQMRQELLFVMDLHNAFRQLDSEMLNLARLHIYGMLELYHQGDLNQYIPPPPPPPPAVAVPRYSPQG